MSYNNLYGGICMMIEDNCFRGYNNSHQRKRNQEPQYEKLFIDESDKQEILLRITSYRLSDVVKSFIDEYEELFPRRIRFEWNFLGTIFKESGVTLSTVEEMYLSPITDCKILICLLYIILDDVAEVEKDATLLHRMIHTLTNDDQTHDQKYDMQIVFLKKLWDFISIQMSRLPRYSEFIDVFRYDFNQVMNSAEYSCLVNTHPEIINSTEMDIYDSYGMIVYLLNGIDLMASPGFDKEELPQLRTIFWHAQQIARIGNTIGTWKREIKEKDFSSGVLAYMLTNRFLKLHEIETLDEEELESIIERTHVIDYLIEKFDVEIQSMHRIKDCIRSLNINTYIKGIYNMMKFHMACQDFL